MKTELSPGEHGHVPPHRHTIRRLSAAGMQGIVIGGFAGTAVAGPIGTIVGMVLGVVAGELLERQFPSSRSNGTESHAS